MLLKIQSEFHAAGKFEVICGPNNSFDPADFSSWPTCEVFINALDPLLTSLTRMNITQVNGCPTPPNPPANSGLAALNFTGAVIPRGGSLLFGCVDGRKMVADFNRSTVEVVCVDGLNWIPPSGGWGQCVTSESRMNGQCGELSKRLTNFENI